MIIVPNTLVLGEKVIAVRQELHGTIRYVGQIDQHLDAFATPHHVTA